MSTAQYSPLTQWILRLARMTRKELRETLRDRRTIVTLLLMPLLVYPLLSIAFRQLLLGTVQTQQPTTQFDYKVAVLDDSQETDFNQILYEGDDYLRRTGRIDVVEPKATVGTEKSEAPATAPSALYSVTAEPDIRNVVPQKSPKGLKQAVSSGEADVGVEIQVKKVVSSTGQKLRTFDFQVYFQPQSAISRDLAHFIERRLQAVNEKYYGLQLQQQRIQQIPGAQWKFTVVPVTSTTGHTLATLIPLILILMTITGAVYPAIDLTAGERERGTLEALMAAPVPRLKLLVAKYIAVLTVALLTASVNLTSMFVTLYGSGLSTLVFGPSGLSLLAILEVLALLTLFAAFFSAILLALTSFARSFKEAQAYLIPLMLVSMAPGFLSILPGIQLTTFWAITPLANIVLLARDILQGSVDSEMGAIAIFSSVLYAFAALALAARVFGSDAILYGSQGSWADLFRRPEHLPQVATLSGAALCTALVFPVQTLLQGLLLALNDRSFEVKLLTGGFATFVIYGLLSYVMARLQFVPIRSGFQLRWPSLVHLAAGGILGLSLWPLAHEGVVLLNQWQLVVVDPNSLLLGEKILGLLKASSPWIAVLALGIVPPICEEWFFRGYLQGALRGRFPAWAAIAGSALCFGLFHVLSQQQFSFVRLMPSTLMGVVLGLICYRSHSIIPGIVLHAVHNSLLVLMACRSDQIEPWLKSVGLEFKETQHLPPLLIVGSLAAVACGLGLILFTRRSDSPEARA